MVEVPAEQLVQNVLPDSLWYVPFGHCIQTPPEAKVPGAHCAGDIRDQRGKLSKYLPGSEVRGRCDLITGTRLKREQAWDK